MDPIIALATIVQLLGVYRAEGSSRAVATKNDFLVWLVNHKHESLKEFIVENCSVDEELSDLFRNHFETLSDDLRELNKTCLGVASKMSTFSNLAEAANPEEILSEQAISILSQYAASESDNLQVLDSSMGRTIWIAGGA